MSLLRQRGASPRVPGKGGTPQSVYASPGITPTSKDTQSKNIKRFVLSDCVCLANHSQIMIANIKGYTLREYNMHSSGQMAFCY